MQFKKQDSMRVLFCMSLLAEEEGVEPSIPCGIPAFQASALGHYATLPGVYRIAHHKAKIKLSGLILVNSIF